MTNTQQTVSHGKETKVEDIINNKAFKARFNLSEENIEGLIREIGKEGSFVPFFANLTSDSDIKDQALALARKLEKNVVACNNAEKIMIKTPSSTKK